MAAMGADNSDVPGLGNGWVGTAEYREGWQLLRVSEMTSDY